jgi:hypothetical protein
MVSTLSTVAQEAVASVTGGNTAISRILALTTSLTKTVTFSDKKFLSGVGSSKISMDGRRLLRAKTVQQQFAS